MLAFNQLTPLLRGRSCVDVPCPECSPYRRRDHRKLKVLRIWAMADGMVSFHCAHCEESGYAWDGVRRSKAPSMEEKRLHQAKRDELELAERARRTTIARQIWHEGQAPWGTWVEDYLTTRGLALPDGIEAIRFHPHCRFPDRVSGPAMVAAFTGLLDLAHADLAKPILPVAIHRIRGKGHANKAMLGPVADAAIMLTPAAAIGDELGVCEGVETGLAIIEQFAAPVWALGSAGAIERFRVLKRVKHLTVWADKDGTGIRAAQRLGEHYAAAGRHVTIRWPEEAKDYAGR